MNEFIADPIDVERLLRPFDPLAERVVALAASCNDLEPEQMNDQQKLALAIVGGCPWEFTGTGIRVTVPFAIQKIHGQIRVSYSAQRRGADHD